MLRRLVDASYASGRDGAITDAQLEFWLGGDVAAALAFERAAEMLADREYWAPLRRELEALRHDARRN